MAGGAPASAQERAQAEVLAAARQAVTGEVVKATSGEQGSTGETPAEAAQTQSIRLDVVKPPSTKRGFVLLPKR